MSGSSPSTFDVRRARLKFTGQVTNNTRYGVQIDASGAVTSGTNANQQVTTREAYVAYTLGNGNAAKNLTATAGLFATPFGYALPQSMANSISPERPLAFSEGSAGIFNSQDYDKGLQLSYNTGQQLLFLPAGLKLTAAVVNGTGRTSDDTDAFKDQIYRVGYQSPNKVVSLGGSYYYGQVDTPNVVNFPAAGTGPQYTGRKKELYGADAQIITPAGPFVLAEYVGGLYEQRSFFNQTSATPYTLNTSYAKDNHIDGYYATAGWTFGQTGNHALTLAYQYDTLKRGEGPGGSDAYTDENNGYGVLYGLDKATRLRFWFEKADKVAHLVGTPEPPRYGLFTGEIQVKF
ncbi:MAG: porin [Janthinobacterium lividum]